MTPEQTLDRRLHDIMWRVRLLLAWRWCSRLLCAASAGCAVWALLSRFTTVDEPSLRVLGIILGCAAGAGILAGALLRITPIEAARLIDQRAGVRERIATAVELVSLPDRPALGWRQVQDAAEHALELDVRRALPLRWKRELVVFLALVLVLFALLIAPRMPYFWSTARKNEMVAVRRQGQEVDRVAREAETLAAKRNLPETRKAVPKLRKLAKAMRQGELDKKMAMVHMTKLTRDIAEQQKRIAAENRPSEKTMAQAGAEAQSALKQLEQAQKEGKGKRDENARDLKDAGESRGLKTSDSEAMKASQESLKEFAKAVSAEDAAAQSDAMRKLAEQLASGNLTKSEALKLSAQLKQLSKALKGSPVDPEIQRLLRQIAEELRKHPDLMKKLAEMARKASGQCNASGQCKLDKKALEALLKALKEGKLNLAGMCKGGGGAGLKPGSGMMGLLTSVGGGKGVREGGRGYVPNVDTKRRITAAEKAPNTKIGGQNGPGSETGPSITYKGAPDRGERAVASYYNVYAQQKREAEGAVGRENIPAQYRDQVKRYFESVRP